MSDKRGTAEGTMSSLPEKQPLAAPRTGAWDDVAERLRDALAQPDSDTQIRAAVREWCETARDRQLAPEQFLVVLKSQFSRIPDLQRRDERTQRNAQFERLVSMCIEEYYAALAGSQANASVKAEGQRNV
jgi:hypothetical protein